jgi:mRNA deadenylase 3'-5' endonuclease subunit Ccr4
MRTEAGKDKIMYDSVATICFLCIVVGVDVDVSNTEVFNAATKLEQRAFCSVVELQIFRTIVNDISLNIINVSVFLPNYPPCKAHAPYYVFICGLSDSITFFPHYLINCTIFWKKFLNLKF